MNGTQHPVPVIAGDQRAEDVRPLNPEEMAALYERIAVIAYGLTALPAGGRR